MSDTPDPQLEELKTLVDDGQYRNLELYLLSASEEDKPNRRRLVQGVIESIKSMASRRDDTNDV